MNRGVQKQLKPGVNWMSLEASCSRILLEGLIKLGIVKGSADALLSKLVHRLFMPHSLGHLLVYLF